MDHTVNKENCLSNKKTQQKIQQYCGNAKLRTTNDRRLRHTYYSITPIVMCGEAIQDKQYPAL